MQTPQTMPKDPTQFMLQVTMNYSDNSGQSMERRFNIKEDDDFQRFMQQCDKVYQTVRYTFGPEAFDKLTIKEDVDAETN